MVFYINGALERVVLIALVFYQSQEAEARLRFSFRFQDVILETGRSLTAQKASNFV